MKSDDRLVQKFLSQSRLQWLVPLSIMDAENLEDVRTEVFGLALKMVTAAAIGFAVLYWFLTKSLVLVGGMAVGVFGLISLLVVMQSKRSVGLSWIGHCTLFVGLILIGWIAVHTGGLHSSGIYWMILLPATAYLFAGWRAGFFWVLAGSVAVGGVFAADHLELSRQLLLDGDRLGTRLISLILLMGLIWMVFLLAQTVQFWLVRQLREKENKLRLVLDTAPNGIVTVDEEGTIRGMNRAAEEMFGRTEQAMRDRSVTELVPTLNVEAEGGALSVEGDDNPLESPHRGRRAEGEEFPISLSTGNYQRGTNNRCVMVLRDDSKIREMHGQIMRLDRLSAVGTLATGVAHEINNPLSYIKGNLEYIHRSLRDLQGREELVEFDIDEVLDAISDGQHGLERIAAIVDDLRTFSRVDRDPSQVIDPVECIESSLSVAENKIAQHARLICQFDDMPPVRGDAGSLSQVVLNLLLNAVQAIPEGAAEENEIEISTEIEDDRVAIVVRDTGKGIAPEDVERVFDPFFTTKKPDEGTGLGLSISQNIVAEMGGSIDVESEPGKGTTFRVWLPMAEFNDVIDESERVPTDELPDIDDGRVLIIDDNPRVCMALERVLSRAFEVEIETDAKVGLNRLLDGEDFHVIVVDLMMPQYTGMEFYDRLLSERDSLCDRVVFITGGIFTSQMQAFVEEQQLPVVRKPFESTEIFDLLDGIISAQQEDEKRAESVG